MARAFAAAPRGGAIGVIVTGPFLPAADRERLDRAVRGHPDVAVEGFVPGVDRWMAGARAVVSMAGYNTVCELLACGQHALLVPRVRPRAEQLLRARQLAARGVADVLHPDEATPGALGDWLLAPHPPLAGGTVDLDGLTAVAGLAAAPATPPTSEELHCAVVA